MGSKNLNLFVIIRITVNASHKNARIKTIIPTEINGLPSGSDIFHPFYELVAIIKTNKGSGIKNMTTKQLRVLLIADSVFIFTSLKRPD